MSWIAGLTSVFIYFFVDVNGASEEVEQHLAMGMKLVSAGQLSDALSHYHAAVEGDSSNFLTYFKRATVLMAMGRSRSALPDLDEAIKLNPKFYQAFLQRGNVHLKRGETDLAHIDFETVLRYDKENEDALKQLSLIDPFNTYVENSVSLMEMGDFSNAIEQLTKALEIAPWDASLRSKRAECYEVMGELYKAVTDIKTTTKLVSDNTGAFLQISKLHYQMGDLEDGLREIRECLKLDPDHKDCFTLYKKLKKLNKQFNDGDDLINKGRYSDAIQKFKAALKTEPALDFYILKAKSKICHCHRMNGDITETLNSCTEAIELDENNVDALCDRAEGYILNEMYEEAVNDYQTAKNINGDLHKVNEGMEKAQRLLKQSKKRDYYKILKVKRNASKREIMKAYRKLAVKWHPDHYEGEDKKKAERMFIDIAAAKEVLTDPEKKAKFDNGEDPLDPEQQNGGGWQNGGFPGGFPFGQGFQFKFHFP
ncbi:dnaJ homolog subfamily C member 3-like [Xenia sp. Carnegie-2017]|uniref:dnaJ homolog subfamily C member 3-like n=1 Tax=Xenia sp. Carnegie-2017 TaxID=2897299 RepID=UPI001F034220|nr:dnaJ homolog subfamily C member 3-like [Xenia sp. Carnegie-2017]